MTHRNIITGGNLTDRRGAEKGFVESEVPARSKENQKKAEVRSEVFSLCSIATVTYGVSSLFVVTKCSSYSKI
jgi:hypothetical protein